MFFLIATYAAAMASRLLEVRMQLAQALTR